MPQSVKTRDKIIGTSRELFNQMGFGAPTLYTLSQRIGISRGNLTYYFKTKEDLLYALVEEMVAENKNLYDAALSVPSWKSLYDATEGLHQLQRRYAFIFFNRQLLLHPIVNEHIRKFRKENIQRQMDMIQLSIQIGNMHEERVSGTYYNISQTYWMVSFYWLITSDISGGVVSPGWDKIMWSLLLPHFTDRGIESFINYFGMEYYESLGGSFGQYVIKSSIF